MLSVDNGQNLQNNENTEDNGPEDRSTSPISTLTIPKEWTYTMRRCMQEVAPHVYLGPYSSASRSKLEALQEKGITHIVCVRQDIEAHFIKPNFPDLLQYLVLDIADIATENIIQHFQKVRAFIDEALDAGGQVLVHGNAGISRSAALVIAYVMEKYDLSQLQAYSMIQQTRFCVNPNEGFMAQLREYEPIYKAQKDAKADGQQNALRPPSKRTIDQLDTEKPNEIIDPMDS